MFVGMQTAAATEENIMEVPQNVKNKNTYNPIIPLLDIKPKKTKTLI